MSARKEWEMSFMLSASMSGSYSATFNKAQSQIASIQKELDSLSKTQSDISSYQKQQQAVEATRSKLEMLKQQYANIQQEMEETGEASASMKNQLLAKQMQIEKTSSALDSQTAKLNSMSDALTAAGVDTGNLTEESKNLASELDGLRERQEKVADSANSLSSRTAQAFDAMQQAIAAAGITEKISELYDAYAECVTVAADFESSMSQVAATMGVSSDDVEELADFAKKMGAETSFSAVEAAEGLNILAMAGLNATEQISALPTVLDLATAGDMDMATAASYVTGAVKGFSDEMENAGYYADLMAKGATMANTDVKGLGEALSGTAATASSYGQAADSVTLSLLRLAEQNVTGSEAATMLNRAMADLYTPTDDAKEALSELGVSCYEANGDARDLNDVVDDLNVALSTMSQEEQNTYKDTIFTTNGLQAFNKICVSSTETVEKFWTGLENSGGSASKQAATQLDNLNGALTILESATEGLKITIGEEFNPELTELANIGAELLSGVNDFVAENPALVKGMTVFIGLLGAATVGMVAYGAAVKVVKALDLAALFTGPGAVIAGVVVGVSALVAGIVALSEATKVELGEEYELTAASREQYRQLQELNAEYEKACELYGETSYEAQSLKWQIEDLNAEYEAGKQTLDEYQAAHDSLMENYSQMTESFDGAKDSIDTETDSTIALINKLAELTSTSESTAQNQDAIQVVIDKLNESLPELAINYDKLINGGDDYIESLRSIAEEQAKQKKIEEEYNEYGERISASSKLKENLDAATANKNLAQTEYDAAYDAWTAAVELFKYDTSGFGMWFGTKDEAAAVDSAKEQLDAYTTAMQEASDAYEENQNAIESLEESFIAYHQELTETSDDTDTMNAAIDDTITAINDLTDAYDAAYEAALTSVQGQYQLWDEAEAAIATSAETINSNLQSQITYWQDYNTNLSNLRDRTDDIAGLSEMIASFADGSTDSVNAIAGMATASDEDLQAMVENWQELQEEQSAVSESIADLKTDFTQQMTELQQNLADTVEDMNLSEEAAQAGADTIQGLIDGANSKLSEVQTAYANLGRAAAQALSSASGAAIGINIPKYASETRDAEAGLALVGENGPELVYLNGGEQIMTAAETAALQDQMQITAFAPALLAALSGTYNEPLRLDSDSFGGGVTFAIENTFNIEGGVSEESVDKISFEFKEKLREEIIDCMLDYQEDKLRVAYR